MSQLSYTVIDSAPESLHKTSIVITGETEAVVVDAAFTRADGHRIAAEVLDAGKTLTTVVITAGDPDFYFGAEVLQDAFPDAVFLAPADVIEHIKASYEGKLQAWAHLGANLPTRLVEFAELTDNTLTIDDTAIEVRRGSDLLGDRAWYLFEEGSRSLIGGVLLFEGLHVWTADRSTPELRANGSGSSTNSRHSTRRSSPQATASRERPPTPPPSTTPATTCKASKRSSPTRLTPPPPKRHSSPSIRTRASRSQPTWAPRSPRER